jgi:hypothetical protein
MNHGPKEAVEVVGPPAMDGSRKMKLECNLMPWPTLNRLEQLGAISVERSDFYRLKNAVGKSGLKRRNLRITITDAGRAALSAPSTDAKGR